MELLDIYDDYGNITGEYVERGPKTKELGPNKHIAICVIFIENSKHQFLIQKTSEEKDSVFASTGGHVDKGEEPSKSIIREVKEELGIDILCVHSDADNTTIEDVVQNKINPAQKALEREEDNMVCKVIVPAIPIQMMESWMLADKDLLKAEIGTNMTDVELGLHRAPESIADPKFVIEEAIRISRRDIVKRRRKGLKIGDIYLSMGQKVSIDKLQLLPSYQNFQEGVRQAYRKLHFLQ